MNFSHIIVIIVMQKINSIWFENSFEKKNSFINSLLKSFVGLWTRVEGVSFREEVFTQKPVWLG